MRLPEPGSACSRAGASIFFCPDPKDIEIEDIAHGLATRGAMERTDERRSLCFLRRAAQSCRYRHRSSSLARLHIERAACRAIARCAGIRRRAILSALSKRRSALDYKAFELNLLQAIYCRFKIQDLSLVAAAAIKQADTIAAYYEATSLAGFGTSEAELFFGIPDVPTELHSVLSVMEPVAANDAQTLFLAKFAELSPH